MSRDERDTEEIDAQEDCEGKYADEKMRRRRRLEKRVAVSMGPAIYEKASAYQMK